MIFLEGDLKIKLNNFLEKNWFKIFRVKWTRMRVFKIYEKSTSGISQIFLRNLQQHKSLKLTGVFFGKSCTENANLDIPSDTLQVGNGKSSSSQILRRAITKIKLLVENNLDSTTKVVKQHVQDDYSFC